MASSSRTRATGSTRCSRPPTTRSTAAVAAQRRLLADEWNTAETVRVRMGIHTGEAEVRDGDYFGGAVNRAERLMSVAQGGQIVVSTATEELLRDALPEKYGFIDLGEHRLRDLGRPEHLFQVAHPDLGREFAPLRTLDTFPQATCRVRSRRSSGARPRSRRLRGAGLSVGAGDADRGGRGRQDPPGVAGRGATWSAEFPRRCVVVRVRAGRPIRRRCGRRWRRCLRVQPLPGRALGRVGARRISRRSDCCWCSTTVSISSMPSRAWSTRSSSVAHGCRCWRRAGKGSGWRGSGSSRCRRWASRPVMPTCDDVQAGGCGALFWDRAQRGEERLRAHRSQRRARSGCCVGASTGSRWRSSSRRRVCGRCHRRISSPASTSGSSSSPTAVARRSERHQTLRSTIDWSYDLLDPDRASGVATGCRCSPAAVTSPRRRRCLSGDDLDVFDVVDVLGQLVDKSLVVADDDDDGGVRYRLLETIRQYAAGATRREWRPGRRCDAATPTTTSPLAEAAGPHLRSREQLEWSQRRRPRHRQLPRCARLGGRDTVAGARAAPGRALGTVQGRIGELAMDWAATAIAIPGGDGHPLFPVVAAWAAWGATMRLDFERAEDLVAVAERAQAALGVRLATVARAQAHLRVLP